MPRRCPAIPIYGHTLKAMIKGTRASTGAKIQKVYVDKGYRSHDATDHRFHVDRSGQNRGVHGVIKRELTHTRSLMGSP